MRIEVWSDVVCPWCYIGKRRLERAIEEFPHATEVEVLYRSFELDPSAPQDATEQMDEVLARKYGGGVERARAMMAEVSQVAAAEGLEYQLERTLRGSTRDAHRLLHLALEEHGPALQRDLKEALLAAYLTEARDVADADVLRKVAAAVGLDQGRVDDVLGSDEYRDAVRADVAQARSLGVTGVPFFVVDHRFRVAGAQPVEVLREVLDRAWAGANPDLTTVAGDLCGPQGCDG
jgi:predicted DsbA family dithiol-disulfide isomerase